MKGLNLGFIIIAGIGAYILYKMFSGKNGLQEGGYSGPAGGPPQTINGNNVLLYEGKPAAGYHGFISKNQKRAWAGGQYGKPGQPSVNFAINTLYQASQIISRVPVQNRTITQTRIVNAASAVGSAPPRVVAKIKAGLMY